MLRFVPSRLDPQRMIAVATLNTLRAMLRGSNPHQTASEDHPTERVTVRVQDHPSLDNIGGVARVEPGPGGAVGIARISRTSFVAFELDSVGLHELAVQVEPDGLTLAIARDSAPTGMVGKE